MCWMQEHDNLVVLVDEEGREHEFTLVDVLELDEERYAILLPEGEIEEAIILKMGTDENGEEILFDIEDDDEWEMVAKAWQELVNQEDGYEQ
ncbi:hypothetical protein PTH_1066 [Calderihabitans maritimus]|uniref:UPF0473 protein KKC1_33290 n=2 Tax=Calderihabitans maritimus TaxID=1246530 RepID=A0A1Z5HXW9_9FIRM|nr:hypothetical protein PTH_1066 [Calderihabitans maritimus]